MSNDHNDNLGGDFGGHEEDEYEFSDDHVTYEAAPDESKEHSSRSLKEKIVAASQRYRRVILAAVVFLVLIFIVYKILSPPASLNPEIKTPGLSTAKMPTKMVASEAPVAQPPVAVVAPVAAPPESAPVAAIPAPLAAPIAQEGVPSPPAQVTGNEANQNNSTILERVATLEQQNAKVMNQQALGGPTNQEVVTKLEALNARVAGLETVLAQLTQMIQAGKGPTAPPPQVRREAAIPRITYTVQAIIPGRAWLKSEAGDTVTVAEGDMLKGLGRIAKIDPYDGVVEIDTGNKMISLSYGTNGN